MTDHFPEYDHLDGLAMAALVKTRQVQPAELLDAALVRLARWEPHVNALSARFAERARCAIDNGLPAGPFEGVPFLVKDLGLSLAGTRTAMGARLFAEFVPDHDSTLAERYRQAGLVIFGKTTTLEMGFAVSTETTLTGTTRNPWNLDRTAGGPPAARRWPWRPGSCRSRTPATAVARSGFQRRRAAFSV